MDNSNKALSILLVFALSISTSGWGQKVLENHFEVVELFSKVKSKSKSLVSYAKRNMEGSSALDTVELKYMDLKEVSDGAISRYKSIIDNPSLAKKTEATLTENLNELNDALVALQSYIRERANTGMGFQQMNPVSILASFTGLGGNLIKELNGMQKAKKDAAKSELDQFKMDDWVEIK